MKYLLSKEVIISTYLSELDMPSLSHSDPCSKIDNSFLRIAFTLPANLLVCKLLANGAVATIEIMRNCHLQ